MSTGNGEEMKREQRRTKSGYTGKESMRCDGMGWDMEIWSASIQCMGADKKRGDENRECVKEGRRKESKKKNCRKNRV